MADTITLNALALDNPIVAAQSASKVNYAGERHPNIKTVTFYKTVQTLADANDLQYNNLYLPSLLLADEVVNAVAERAASGANVIVTASSNLYEVGKIESRFHLSPIMLLHKIGVLDLLTLADLSCADNDDLDLIAQHNVKTIILPTYSAGTGNGFAPVIAMLNRGIKINIGTGSGFNPTHSLELEAKYLSVTTAGLMHEQNILSNKAALALTFL